MSIQRIASLLEKIAVDDKIKVAVADVMIDNLDMESAPTMGIGSRIAPLVLVPNVTAPAQAGETLLEGRSGVLIINLSENVVWVGFDENVTPGAGIPIHGSSERVIHLKRSQTVPLFLLCEEEATLTIVEVK